jgi:hypothetical protein
MAELAGYDFVQTIGHEATGSVYLARQVAQNRYVAAKQVVGAWNGDPEVLVRCQREAIALAGLNHPNVVGFYELATDGTDLYLITEYVPGASLRQLLDRSPLTIAQGLRVLGEVAAALQYAGHQGVVHGDLKPGNVLITAAGVSKLADLGLATILSGKPEIDQRADVYALSVMAYELLVGRLPFPSSAGDVMAGPDAHAAAAVARPTTMVPGFPRQVEEAILQGLDEAPSLRPKSPGELWQKLSVAAERAWPGWAPLSDLAVIAAAAAPPPPPPLPAPGTAADGSAPPADAAIPDPPARPLPAYAAAAPPFRPPLAPPPPGPPGLPPGAYRPGFAPLPAAVGTASASHVGSSGTAPPVSPPALQKAETVKPKVDSHGGAGALIVIAVCAVLIGAAAYYLAVTRFHVLGGDLPLTVSAASAAVDNPNGKCPNHTYVFTGRVKTNGAGGKITYEWVKPDGTATNTATASIPSGETESIATLQFTFQGNGQAAGDAVLHVISPANIKSTPSHVQYVCP